MNVEQFFEKFELIADAPNAVQKMRELVLHLAVHGRLVDQASDDEPAIELLRASRAAMARLMEIGLAKREKPAAPVSYDEATFELPVGWAWCRLVDAGQFINGLAFKPSDWGTVGRPIIRIQNLSGRNPDYNRTTKEFDSSVLVQDGDILVSWSGTLDAFVWKGEEGVLNQHIFRVIPAPLADKGYLFWLLKWVIRELAESDHAHGLVMSHINRGPFLARPIPLPPLAEQKRIVAKVDELMALCDQLEAQQHERDAKKAELARASLARFAEAPTPANLEFIFHKAYDITPADLRKLILTLAVQGRLVPQDPNDEPAEILLARLMTRNVQDSGRRKRSQPDLAITPEAIPYELPSGWAWQRLGNIGETNIGLTYSPQDVAEVGIPVLRSSNIQNGKLDLDDLVRVTCEPKRSVMVQDGDLLICVRNGSRALVGKVAVLEDLKEPAAFGAFMAIYRSEVNSYLYHFIRSPLFRQMIDDVNTTTINQITQSNLRSTLAPIPPFSEQLRIVEKVNQLMALVDDLELHLTEARLSGSKLLDSIITDVAA